MILNETVRKAEPRDLDSVVHVEKQFGVFAFKPSVFKKRFGSHLFKVLEVEGVVIGYYLLLSRKNSRTFRLYSICVDKTMHGHGYGKLLMRDVINQCGPGSTIKLEVRWDNHAAKKLYASFGFGYTKLLKGYYGDEDGVEMRLSA